ncbi:hypothetical protein BDW59DRAFT_149097 [Aspergillus cavernicola]|uniref:Uncharacterized protein n=1 Tax=Aspergillus cavernicola TaxID=176166 RepID=A0ABR4I4R8_9EURO
MSFKDSDLVYLGASLGQLASRVLRYCGILEPFIVCSISNFVNAVRSSVGGWFNAPVRLKVSPCWAFPKSHCTTPPNSSMGVLTTTSPNLTNFGTPPPIPTIRPNLIEGKVEVIRAATVAAVLLPNSPFGKHATTTLCTPTRPRV